MNDDIPTVRRIATLTLTILLLLTTVPAISLSPDVPNLPEVAPSGEATHAGTSSFAWNRSAGLGVNRSADLGADALNRSNATDATAPVTENLTTTASHCPSNAVIQPDPKDPGGTADEATGLVLDLAQCNADHVTDLVPPVPCVDESCPDPCEKVSCEPEAYCEPDCPQVPPPIPCVNEPCPPLDPCNYVDCGPSTDPCDHVDCNVPRPECSDGRDNDGDGHTDHPDDPGCVNEGDPSEKYPASGGAVTSTSATFTPDCSGTYIVYYKNSAFGSLDDAVPKEELLNGNGAGVTALVVEIISHFIPSAAGGGEDIEFWWDYTCVVEGVLWKATGEGGTARQVVIEAPNAAGERKQEGEPCEYDGVVITRCTATWDEDTAVVESDQGVDTYPHDGIPETASVCVDSQARGANYLLNWRTGDLIEPGTKSFPVDCVEEDITWERKEMGV